jgi:hypothetical protein
VWAKHRLDLGKPFIIHENVPQFGVSELTSCSSSTYTIIARRVLCPTQFGWPSKRKRQFVLCVHNSLLSSDVVPGLIADRFSTMLSLFERSCGYGLIEYAVACDDELLEAHLQSDVESRPITASHVHNLLPTPCLLLLPNQSEAFLNHSCSLHHFTNL